MLSGIMSEGYGVIPKKYMRDNTLGTYAKLVGAYFLSYTGGGVDVCWPSQQSIAEDLSISVATVKKSVAELESKGYLVKEKKYPGSKLLTHNQYRITIIENYDDLKKYSDSLDKAPDSSVVAVETKSNKSIQDKQLSNISDSSVVAVESLQIATNNNIVTNTNKNKENISGTEKNEIESIYQLYPSKCTISNRSTGKTLKDKQLIEKLLKTMTSEKLRAIIKRYLAECLETKTYLKNFKTFLNNMPDYEESKPDTVNENTIITLVNRIRTKQITTHDLTEYVRQGKIMKQEADECLKRL